MANLLIVEDDPSIQTLLQSFLQEAGHHVDLASDGVEAVASFHQGQYDLILLDLMLPKIDGYNVCEVIRRTSDVPIVMVTALDNEENQLRGYDLTIDDYITKPFSMPILVQKIQAILRRASQLPLAHDKILRYSSITLDNCARTVCIQDKLLDLTVKEYDLLYFMLSNQGRVLTRQRILDQLWQHDYFGDERVVDTHMKNLRRKLGIDIIETIRGVGYRIAKAHP